MIQTLKNVFKIPDLRRKILFTAFILILYRFGSFIPTPGVNTFALREFFEGTQNTLFGLFDLFVGGNFERASIFALGIMPYITCSILIQLLGGIIPYFEKLKKEGPAGQKKINQLTRYGTVIIGTFNALGMVVFLQNAGPGVVTIPPLLFGFTTVISMVTGTMVILWLGEQITEHGLGNGISMIIFAGIIAQYPEGFLQMFMMVNYGVMPILTALSVVGIMLFVTAAVILVTEATRRLHVQYPKKIIGRKVIGGRSSYIPLKVNSAGVIPIIFAQSVIMMPATIATFFPNAGFAHAIVRHFTPGTPIYTIFFMTLIVFFAYFYTAIVLNPTEMAETMRKQGGFIHGQQPGKSTAKYINNILTKITLPGAIFFAIIAVIPEFMMKFANLPFYFGGTGIIIIVGVALETLNQIQSHLVMRHYDGFMKKGKLRGRSQ
ncbi:MAG: preprotein translocase subunit SecY [Candidatus Cloacimonetes bacterium]|nr:preprotein translocase subunit SecY [Candidatus Cloacimonadota bacterium]